MLSFSEMSQNAGLAKKGQTSKVAMFEMPNSKHFSNRDVFQCSIPKIVTSKKRSSCGLVTWAASSVQHTGKNVYHKKKYAFLVLFLEKEKVGKTSVGVENCCCLPSLFDWQGAHRVPKFLWDRCIWMVWHGRKSQAGSWLKVKTPTVHGFRCFNPFLLIEMTPWGSVVFHISRSSGVFMIIHPHNCWFFWRDPRNCRAQLQLFALRTLRNSCNNSRRCRTHQPSSRPAWYPPVNWCWVPHRFWWPQFVWATEIPFLNKSWKKKISIWLWEHQNLQARL